LSYVLKAVQSFIEDEINSYFVAYSGGLDSSILLLEVQEALKKSQLKTLKAIHINHNYSKNSKKMGRALSKFLLFKWD
jgi:tRNA(Ile)-lysidine synthase TilS/MesJ